MNSTPSVPDVVDDRSLRLPAHSTTVTAEELRVRLVLAIDRDGGIEIDASQVESIGQATLQLLVAARAETKRNDQPFSITHSSAAFIARVTGCRLAGTIGLETERGEVQ